MKAMIEEMRGDIRAATSIPAGERHLLTEMLASASALQNGSAGDAAAQGHAIGLLSLLLASHIVDGYRSRQEPRTRIERIVAALTPFRWPLCVVLVAAFALPNAPAAIAAIRAIFAP